MTNIVPIVEGLGDVVAVPVLLRRLLAAYHVDRWDVGIARPIRLSRGKLRKVGELERALQLAMQDRDDVAAVLVIMDLDDDDLDELIAEVETRADGVIPVVVGVSFAVIEFEAWFLGAKESLRGFRGIRPDAESPPEPEGIRDAKGRLERNMVDDRRYVETADQAAFAATFDLAQAATRCPSFARLIEVFATLVQATEGQPEAEVTST